jgi:hypothetical protein
MPAVAQEAEPLRLLRHSKGSISSTALQDRRQGQECNTPLPDNQRNPLSVPSIPAVHRFRLEQTFPHILHQAQTQAINEAIPAQMCSSITVKRKERDRCLLHPEVRRVTVLCNKAGLRLRTPLFKVVGRLALLGRLAQQRTILSWVRDGGIPSSVFPCRLTRANPIDLLRYDAPLSGPKITRMLHQLQFKLQVEEQYKRGIEKMGALYRDEGDKRLKNETEVKKVESQNKIQLLRRALKRYETLRLFEDVEDDGT